MKMIRRKTHPWLRFFLGFFSGCSIVCLLRLVTLKKDLPFCSVYANVEHRVGYSSPVSRSNPSNVNYNESQTASNETGLLFIGVMTAEIYLKTRANAIHSTWGKNVPGKLVFFSSENSKSNSVPLVPLKGVDDSYPPQKKSFLMFKYMYDHYLQQFEWFMRADDDVYVRTEQLAALLRSLNSSRPLFIGQAGVGNKQEFGQLHLQADENFCMGGPGMILSRVTLQKMAPHIRYCLKHLYSTHEDVEVGRCIRRFVAIPCTWSYEMSSIFYHNVSGEAASYPRLHSKEVRRAITLHPIKNSQNLFRLHSYYQGVHIQDLRYSTIKLHRELLDLASSIHHPLQLLPELPLANSSLLGRRPTINKYYPQTSSDILTWDFIQKNLFPLSGDNPKLHIPPWLQIAVNDVIMEVMETINKFSKQRGRVIEFKDIYYGYYRVNPLEGVEYILDLLLTYKKYSGKKMTVPVRRHAYLHRPFSMLEIKSFSQVPYLKKAIHFIVPLYRKTNTFTKFLERFRSVCLERNEPVKLVIVMFADANDHESPYQAKMLLDSLRAIYPAYELKLIETSGVFSRALALEIGAKIFPLDSLLFFVDVDIVFDQSALERIRLNTVHGVSVYFPIVFSQYDPEFIRNYKQPDDPLTIDRTLGYWRQFGFGIVSLYNSDLQSVGGLNVEIKGWGKEDVDLYERIVQSNLTVFRAPDPGLCHVFHPIVCDSALELPQFEMCIGSKLSSMGPYEYLADFVMEKLILSNEFADSA